MVQARRPESLLRETWAAYIEHGEVTAAAARSMGKPVETVRCILKECRKKGYHLSDGARRATEQAGLSGGEVRGGWIHNYDDDGKKVGATRWTAPEFDAEGYLDKVRAAFEDIPAAPAIAKPEHTKKNSVAFFPHQDWHLGSEASEERVGRAYNPKVAVERLKDGFSQCHAAIEPSEVAIILNNGDLTHGNDDTDATPRHKHRLKITGTHEDNLTLAVHSTIWMIDTALERHERVEYVANRGNHDPSTPSVLRLALSQRYRDEPRVKICQRQREMWVWQKGRLFLSAVHGDGLKPKEQAANIPPKYPREFGVSDFWYLFTGHYHSPESKLYGGIRHFQLPALCTIDPHADDLGYFDSSAMRAMRFDIYKGIKNDYTASL
jgi:hypothetical protein